MASGAQLSVEHVEYAGTGQAACIVRCLAGAVSPGDTFDTATSGDGGSRRISLTVARIWLYGRETDLIDLGLTGRVELVGPDAALLPGLTRLAYSSPG